MSPAHAEKELNKLSATIGATPQRWFFISPPPDWFSRW